LYYRQKSTTAIPCKCYQHQQDDGERPTFTVRLGVLVVLHHSPSTVLTAAATAAKTETNQREDKDKKEADHNTGAVPRELSQVL
jgi:hypothetical protein